MAADAVSPHRLVGDRSAMVAATGDDPVPMHDHPASALDWLTLSLVLALGLVTAYLTHRQNQIAAGYEEAERRLADIEDERRQEEHEERRAARVVPRLIRGPYPGLRRAKLALTNDGRARATKVRAELKLDDGRGGFRRSVFPSDGDVSMEADHRLYYALPSRQWWRTAQEHVQILTAWEDDRGPQRQTWVVTWEDG